MSISKTEVEKAVEWVSQFAQQRKTINTQHTSYGLKHIAEKWANHYISNDSFIEAMDQCGFKKRRMRPSSPNFYFNIRSL